MRASKCVPRKELLSGITSERSKRRPAPAPGGGRGAVSAGGVSTGGVQRSTCLQVVFNNAGIARWGGLESVNEGDLLDCFKVNTLAHIFVVQALLKRNLLQHGSLIANLTSLVRNLHNAPPLRALARRREATTPSARWLRP